MASCKDCVHVEVCCEKNLHVAVGMNIIPRFKYKRIEQECEHFKNRARFVELPFQLGDDVYCTRMFKIYKKTVKKIELDDEGIAIITEDGYCIDSSICFRSQKEAEQALMKEREKYGQGTDD